MQGWAKHQQGYTPSKKLAVMDEKETTRQGPSQLLVLPLSDTSVLLLWSPVLQYVPGGEYRVRVSSGNSTGAFVYVGLALSYIFSNLDATQNKTFEVQWLLPAVTNVTLSSITTSSVNVSWILEDTDGVDGFQVSWCVTTSCPAKLNDITAQTFKVIQYLQDFTNYTIFVCTYQDQQYKTFVGPCVNVTVRTRPAPPPGPVALPLSQTSIIVLWGPKPSCPSISSYRIRIVAVGNTTAFQYTEQLSYTYQNLQPTTKYMFQLEWCPLEGICSDPVDVRGSTV
ncbi:fibronectin [Ixodes scapularis]|uniref:fibronectin n=1 Tax=Ixodes scapularis TaxID=6945 RepID=UPI001A9D8687|nr:fibronectin [Ixodes scapularis]